MRLNVASMVAVVGLMPFAASAGIVETFTYPDGPLTTGSGGVWQLWAAGAGDGTASGGTGVVNASTDVARLFTNELQAAGTAVNYSFDVNVPTGSVAGDYVLFFSPTTGPFETGQNYAQSLGFRFDWSGAAAGLTNVGVWPPTGAGNVATMTTGVWHTISGFMVKDAASISYQMRLDGVWVNSGSFAHTDAAGINSVEIYNQTGGAGSCAFDNINLQVPTPGTLAFVALGSLGLLRRRRA